MPNVHGAVKASQVMKLGAATGIQINMFLYGKFLLKIFQFVQFNLQKSLLIQIQTLIFSWLLHIFLGNFIFFLFSYLLKCFQWSLTLLFSLLKYTFLPMLISLFNNILSILIFSHFINSLFFKPSFILSLLISQLSLFFWWYSVGVRRRTLREDRMSTPYWQRIFLKEKKRWKQDIK